MSRVARALSLVAAALLVLVACGEAKETGLPSGPTPEPPPKTAVDVVDSKFEPVEMSVKAGEEVVWFWRGAAPHNVKFTTLKVDSHPQCPSKCSAAGETPYRYKFEKTGRYPYYCVVHGTADGGGMAGVVVVA